jgi:opacity protein-like surface antigen
MRCFTAAVLTMCCVVCFTSGASGQDRVQVIKNRSSIVASNFVTVIATVDAGVELQQIRQQGNWIEVLLPGLNPRRSTGFIARVNVKPVGPQPSAAEPASSTDRPRTVSQSRLTSGLRGFGNIGAGAFLARQSFDAVLGSAPIFGHLRGPWLGGGAQFQSRGGMFFEGGISFFRQTGQRVFVDGDTVFELGIPDALTIMPVTATLGYRFKGRSAAPFIGGGMGQYLFSETTPFDESSDRSWQRANSLHMLGGVEFHVARGLSVAVQGQYTRTPHALKGALGTVLGESDLGGMQFGAKVLIGRPNRVRDQELPDTDDSP